MSVVILTGSGSTFAAGANIKEIPDNASILFKDKLERIWHRVIPKFRKPMITAINGLTLGGGLEIALMADIVLACEQAKLGLPEIKLGMIPGASGTQRVTKVVGKSKAMEMVLTGDTISAREAYEWGLVNQVYPSEKLLMEGALKLASKISEKS